MHNIKCHLSLFTLYVSPNTPFLKAEPGNLQTPHYGQLKNYSHLFHHQGWIYKILFP